MIEQEGTLKVYNIHTSLCAVCVSPLSTIVRHRSNIHFLARWGHQFIVLWSRATGASKLCAFLGSVLLLSAA